MGALLAAFYFCAVTLDLFVALVWRPVGVKRSNYRRHPLCDDLVCVDVERPGVRQLELGVGRLCPILTRRTIAERVNDDRLRANAIEAAEQCGILRVPEIDPPVPLERALAAWDPARQLIFCDEAADLLDPIAALLPLRGQPVAVLIGPEGGFAADERSLLRAQSFTLAISLGPRIMRADTAAVAALALVNAAIGDWK